MTKPKKIQKRRVEREPAMIEGMNGLLLPTSVAAAAPPSPAVGVVRRERLEQLVERVAALPVTLVCAPAGFGKTTLLQAWRPRLDERMATAWYSLVEGEVSALGLLDGVTTALGRAIPGFGGSVRPLLAAHTPDVVACATTLANELYVWCAESGREVGLFLDDVHAIIDGSAAAFVLSAFIRGLPPQVHLCISTRRMLPITPLAKLRNAHRLFEIGAAQLRFQLDEAMHLAADQHAAQRILERTDGWSLAVRWMAAVESDNVIGERVTAEDARESLFAFLADEVFAALPIELREIAALLAVPERLDETVVEYLLERSDGAAILARLAASGLHVERTEPGAWRFHQLFREFLVGRAKLEYPDREREIRRRYASLLRRGGEKLAAFEQIVAAGDLTQIVEYAHEALVTLRFSERYRRFLELFAALPEEVKQRKPMLYRFHAIALQRADRYEQADAMLERAHDAALALGDNATACVALLERGIGAGRFRFRGHGTHERSETAFRAALVLAESESLRERSGYRKLAHLSLGLALALRFDYESAREHLQIAEHLENQESEHAELTYVEIARVFAWMGDMRRALSYAELAEDLFHGKAEYHTGYALVIQARALAALGEDPARAIAVAERAIELLQASHEEEGEVGSAYVALIRAALNSVPLDVRSIEHACEQAERYLDKADTSARAEVALLRVGMHLAWGNCAQAKRLLEAAARSVEMCGDELRVAEFFEMRAAIAQECDDKESAFEAFRDAAQRFAQCGDRFGEALARLGAFVCAPASRTSLAREAVDMVAFLLKYDLAYVFSAQPAQALLLLQTCVREGVELRAVESFALRMESRHLLAFEELVTDGELPISRRLVALRLCAAAGVRHARRILTPLVKAEAHELGAAAAQLLDLLPLPDVAPLQIAVVAGISLRIGQRTLAQGDERWGRRKAAELLRFLAVANAPVTKHAALTALWPESDGTNDVSLRVTLHALRRALQPQSEASSTYVRFDGTLLCLNAELVEEVDIRRAFEALALGKHHAALGEDQAALAALGAAHAVLHAVPAESGLPVWLQPHIVRWRAAALETLRLLADVHLRQGRPEEALEALRATRAIDSLDEESQIALLGVLTELGRFDEARDIFAHYKRRLLERVDAAPSAAMLEAYRRLLDRREQRRGKVLSAREESILNRIANGKTSKEIAAELGLSAATINNHVARILRKLHVESRAAAVAVAGLIAPAEEGKPS